MDEKTGKTVAAILGVVGFLLIIAGAFNFIDMKVAIFLALASWVIAPIIRNYSKPDKKGQKKKNN